MLKPDKLYTTDDDFEAIWEVLGKSKDGTAAVRVPREALMHVMMDHAKMVGALFPHVPSVKRQTIAA